MSPPFHICFTFIGDIRFDSRLSRCVQTLASRGFQVSAIIADGKEAKREYSGVNLIPLSVPRPTRAFVRLLIFYAKALPKAIRIDADCYFASDLYSLPLAYLTSRFRRAKLVYDSRELYTAIAALRHRRMTQKFWSFMEKSMITSVNSVFTVNDSLASMIAERYGIPRPTTLLNCPPKRFVRKSDRLRQLLGIPENVRILLYQGGLQTGRGIFASISAIAKIPDAALILLGEGNLRGEIHRHIERENLRGRVYLLEPVPSTELLEYTSSADLGLCLIENAGASYYYSLPNKLFEYIAAGIPVVASNFPEIRRIVDANHVGLTVNPESEEEIVSAIKRILTDPLLYTTFVENCKKTREEYTWEKEETKLLEVIERLQKG